jgi:RpiB/LacA/LacB family sugar-phosphate isomerase
MRIAIGADHAGFTMKNDISALLRGLGHEVLDLGAHQPDPSDDYPDFAEAVGKAIVEGKAERGVLICGSGVGVSVAVNKFPGIRAAVCHDAYSAHQGVEHDNMNVLVLGSRIIGSELARELVRVYIAARFSGDERHVRRLAKVDAIERRYLASKSAPSQ